MTTTPITLYCPQAVGDATATFQAASGNVYRLDGNRKAAVDTRDVGEFLSQGWTVGEVGDALTAIADLQGRVTALEAKP